LNTSRKARQFANFESGTGPEKMLCITLQRGIARAFSRACLRGTVSRRCLGECNAITERWCSEGDLTCIGNLSQNRLLIGAARHSRISVQDFAVAMIPSVPEFQSPSPVGTLSDSSSPSCEGDKVSLRLGAYIFL
jgi:hypothetical protein